MEETYTTKEMIAELKEENNHRFDKQDKVLERIELQTTTTNGRVSKHDVTFESHKTYFRVAWWILGLTPVVISFLFYWGINIIKHEIDNSTISPHELQTAVDTGIKGCIKNLECGVLEIE